MRLEADDGFPCHDAVLTRRREDADRSSFGLARCASASSFSSCNRRYATMPIGHLLVPMRDIQNLRLGKVVALDLQAHGQALFVEATGNRHARSAGQVGSDGKNVV